MAGVLQSMGCWLGDEGDLLKADEHNPMGYFEQAEVMGINDGLLAEVGSTWNDPKPCEILNAQPLWDRMEAVVARGRKQPRWALKDPRFSLTYPLWDPFLEDCKIIVMIRHPIAVARSLEAVHGMGKKEAVALWYRYMEQVDGWPAKYGIQPLYVDYDVLLVQEKRVQKMLKDRYPWLTYFHNKYATMRNLRHHRGPREDLPYPVQQLYERMHRNALSSLDDYQAGRKIDVRWNPARDKWVYERRRERPKDTQPAAQGSEAEAGLLDSDAPGRGVSRGLLREP